MVATLKVPGAVEEETGPASAVPVHAPGALSIVAVVTRRGFLAIPKAQGTLWVLK